MSTVAGVFSETLLQNVIARADSIMLSDRVDVQFIARVEAAKAFLQAMTANMQVMNNAKKDIVLTVWWDNFCEMAVRECVACDTGGTEGSTNTQEYSLDTCKQVVFTVDENNFTNNYADYETHIAKQKLVAKKLLAEYLTQYFIARLNAWAGVNQFTGGQGTVVGTDTFIPAAYWTPELIAYFSQVSELNQLTAPSFLTGSNFYQAAMIAKYNGANADGKGASSMFAAMNPFFDIYNVDAVNNPDLVTYLISKGSVAFASKAIYPMNTPTPIDYEFKGWSEDNGHIPGLLENWKYSAKCSNNRTIHKFAVDINFGAFLNPTGCEAENTGVLRFLCGTGS